MLCSLEGFARFILGVSPRVERFQLSHELEWEWTPGYDKLETYHGITIRTTISSQGLRNEEITVPKPAGTYRIIALGDSITAGPGVELDQTFVKLLEHSLQRESRSGQAIEVINAGTDDYGTPQELTWLRTRGLEYDPDLVLVNIYLNDSRSFDPPPAWIAFLDNFFVSKSAFYYFYRVAVRGRSVNQAIAAPGFRFRFLDAWQSRAWINDSEALTAVIKAADQDWGLAWKDQELAKIEAGLTEIIQLAHKHNFNLIFVLFPTDVQVYAQTDTPLGLDKPQQRLAAFAQSQNIAVLNLLPILRSHHDQDLYFDQAHLKPPGHQLVAKAMAQALLQYQLVPLP